ncbi:MAG: hypothetical protein KDC92_04915 [Bacteroidetes bacterium]|nr:hypothetical protein [Bacteroidota bacterium]
MPFLTECYADQHLIWLLSDGNKKPKHCNDKGRVINFLRKKSGNLGIVDEDPFQAQPTYLKAMTKIDQIHDLQLLKDDNNNHVIVICPRLEEWLEKATKKSGKKISDYFRVKNAKELHAIIHDHLDKIDILVEDMLRLENPYFKTLKSWLLRYVEDL